MIPKILNVDDSETIRGSLRRLFAGFACEWREAANGEEGLAAALQETPDLILSDLNMPVMDGITMIRKMREHPALKRTPVIMLSTDSGQQHLAAAARLGVRDYVIKPFRDEDLLAKVSRIIPLVVPAAEGVNASPDAVSPCPAPAGIPAGAQASHSLEQSAILVVDDSRMMRLALINALNDLGWRNISAAADGRQALELAKAQSFDLVLLDIIMPGMDGYEVCRQLRQMPETAEVPIMFLSSLEEVQSKTRGFEVGANDYLTKPFDVLEVNARVKSLLKAKAYSDAVKEQIASELRVAREIQMGMLPHDFAPVEKRHGVEFGAVLEPAREVGGDLYGVCDASPERLVVFLGDVSGKGLPASMFMVRAVSLARLLAKEIAEPERILARLNDELSADNPSGMFVTFLCAVFEPKSGRLVLANAGHCRPVILHDGQPPRWAVKNLGTALGFEPGLEFERTELTLGSGDAMVLYSDGVTEAFNPQEELYSDGRLLADSAAFGGQSAPAITASLLQKVRAFAGTAPQSDDIAILTLKINPQNPQK
jgi:sigma-B regulation protein RsbU (phosphoserine phosphatase)